jgi:DNA-binding XRE family transcriptional regulator/molybdate-binding protein
MNLLRRSRIDAGLTQADLATRAGVSRQLVGAVEAGRHLPRVDAALALASVLGIGVAELFESVETPVDIVSGLPPEQAALVRAGRVGERVVTSPARIGPAGWDVADGVVEEGRLRRFVRDAPGMVVAGCEPGLEAMERILREGGMGAVSAIASSRTALEALAAGRVHAAVVHGPALGVERDDLDVQRVRLTQWQVGLAAAPDAPRGWWQEALSGAIPVVQREAGAGVQRAFESAVETNGVVAGPRVGTHYEAAHRAVLMGMAGVTIEPAALALGASFKTLETHEAQLWIDRRWTAERLVVAALDVIAGSRFQRRLQAVGGYDLAGCGELIT